MQEQVERRKWQLGMSGELELEKWVVGKPIRTADSNTHATGTHTHTHTHTHTSAHVAGKTKPEAPTCPTSDLFLCICWWKAVQRKKDMEERQAQSEMPQKVKFVFQFVFFLFFVFC